MGFFDDIVGLIGGGGGDGGGGGLGDLIGGPGGDVGGGSDIVSPAGDAGGLISGGGAAAGGGLDFGGLAGSVGSGLKDAAGGLGSFAKGALPFAQIGGAVLGGANAFQGMNQMAQQTKLLKSAQQRQAEAAAPLTSFGQQELALAAKGQVPAAIQKDIDLWLQGAKQKMHDYLARNGMGDSSALQEWDAHLEGQAEQMKAAAIQDMQKTGVGALGQASGAATNAANTASQQQGSLQTLIQEANQQLARLGGAAA